MQLHTTAPAEKFGGGSLLKFQRSIQQQKLLLQICNFNSVTLWGAPYGKHPGASVLPDGNKSE